MRWHMLGMRWAYPGYVLGISWPCAGHILAMCWAYPVLHIYIYIYIHIKTLPINRPSGRYVSKNAYHICLVKMQVGSMGGDLKC